MLRYLFAECKKRFGEIYGKNKIDVEELHIQIFQLYSEANVYLSLKDKGLNIERVVEKKNSKTPDFKININGDEYFGEVNVSFPVKQTIEK